MSYDNLDGLMNDEQQRRMEWLRGFKLDTTLPIEDALEKLRAEEMPATSPEDFLRTLEHMYANEMAASRQRLADEIVNAGYRKPDVTPPGLNEKERLDVLRAQLEAGTIDPKRPNSGLLPKPEPFVLPRRPINIVPKSGADQSMRGHR